MAIPDVAEGAEEGDNTIGDWSLLADNWRPISALGSRQTEPTSFSCVGIVHLDVLNRVAVSEDSIKRPESTCS